MEDPLVSIIINNYDYGRFLGEAIESALNQTYANIEVVVVDDGSTDDSRDIIAGYNGKITAVLKKNGGQASAFNAGFAASRGSIICFLDSDDLFLPKKVERIVQTYNSFPGIGWCFHNLNLFCTSHVLNPSADHEYRPYDMSFSRRYDLRKAMKGYKQKISPPPTSGLTFTRELLNKILPMQETLVIVSDLYLKYIAFSLAPGYFLAEKLSEQRIHDLNHYTYSAKREMIRARIETLTALAVREQYPVLKRFTNNMFAKVLSGGQADKIREGLVERYYANLSLLERLEVRFLTKVHTIRQKMLIKRPELK